LIETPAKAGASFRTELAVFSHASETIAAVDGTIRFGFEGHSGFVATIGTNSCEVLSRGAGCIFAGVAAGFAALWLIHEAALSEEFLFPGCENEFVSAIFAHQCFVFVHV
jgi:hypothetical protein